MIFDRAMSGFSIVQSGLVIEALKDYDLRPVKTLCDVAGGHGHLMCSFLRAWPHLSGTVFDLPEVVAEKNALWAPKLALDDRCRYQGGDMFEDVPAADAYSLKMILHDWNDSECAQILSNLRRRAGKDGRVFIVEHIVPGPAESHFAKLFDIHMMCWGSGRERTEAEFGSLLEAAGWNMAGTHYPANRLMGVIEGRVA